MKYNPSQTLSIKTKENKKGIVIYVDGRPFAIEYPDNLWANLPKNLRQILLENITYAETNWLPLILNKAGIVYNTSRPLFEMTFLVNQLYDMPASEMLDKAPHLSYVRRFFNFDFVFDSSSSPALTPTIKHKKQTKNAPATAIIPFTFGKESLATLMLCRELGIQPILFYVQEPVQPYEQNYKLRKLAELQKKFEIPFYFIKHEPGLFRYGRAFAIKKRSEIGWGAQLGVIMLLAVPIALRHNARYILIGNEASNNERKMRYGWRTELSVDQSTFMMETYNSMLQILTGGQCEIKSSLEPLEEVTIFHLLHTRYPEVSSLQFSCSAERPLFTKTQWCHRCYKCCRMYLFAKALDIDPKTLGFKKNLLNDVGLWKHYFGNKRETGCMDDLTFAFYILYRRRDTSLCTRRFAKTHLAHAKAWQWYVKKYTSLQNTKTLPAPYAKKLLTIFSEELRRLRTILP